MNPLPDRLQAGAPYPLGAHFDGSGVNFAVFSAHAERVELCVFDGPGQHELARFALPEWTDEVWHGYLPDARPGLLYGYRAHGPYAPERGQRFNPNKLLVDPYARQLFGAADWNDTTLGFEWDSPDADLSFDTRDSAAAVPKSVVVAADTFDWAGDVRPNTPWGETVIYEAHVRGLSMRMDEVPPPERGTFAGLAHPKVIGHLQRLGVTAIELLPIQAIADERFLHIKGLTNYWGYNTLGFFAPEQRYLASGSSDEIKQAVRALHAAGIEVILDVVYNHTAEGSELGPTLSFRGLDNATYYRLQGANPRFCVNDTGTGNTLDFSQARVIQLAADSLRYWATEFHVDGFRFDLGVTLGRDGGHGFDPGAAFFDVLRQDPVLGRLKLIFEPWDIGPGGYQLGNLPTGFAEWNDRFRDGIRRYWRGDQRMRPELAARLSGSGDLFKAPARRPWASINYVASHDGQPLADVVAFEQRHNLANGEGNRDGHGENYSSNWGVEGETADPGIRAMRDRVRRSMLVSLFASMGTPMLLAGDEWGRTQHGNNNAYAQDNPTSWLDWAQAASPEGETMTRWVARLAALRRRYPLMRAREFLHGREVAPTVRDLDWFDERGVNLSPDDWHNPNGRALVMRRAGLRADGTVEAITVLMNAAEMPLVFTLPPPALHRRLLLDSADPEAAEREIGETVEVADRAAVLIVGEAHRADAAGQAA